ncbi:MAG TPA: ABC transporter permease [Cytophagales bacterium]|nr:ABC transporter permease [Cytophagales bacterium]HAA17442.1 ABC transporter permease [Cytophagales bacterium]HAP62413.1 ABC transporter permease [Cytophagales bacterium]
MKILKARWWKVLAVILMLVTFVGGFLIRIPDVGALDESIRNLFFHVSMWFSMVLVLTVSLVYAFRYLSTNKLTYDLLSTQYAFLGIVFGMLGLVTGSVWAKFSWGAWWVNDAKLNGAAITMLIYLAYTVLRSSIEDLQSRARISAVFNIFAYAAMVPLLFILPRMTDSLHPGNGGNPGFGTYDLDNTLRLIFYPSILGWTLFGVWIMSIRTRVQWLQLKRDELI